MKNKSGFTLTELLAVLVVLGIILLIAIPSFGNLQKKFKSEYYAKMDANVLVVGKNYYKDNSELRPVSLLEFHSVGYEDLISGNYLESINKYNDNSADGKCTGRIVIMKDNSEYKYKNCMDCGEYKNYKDLNPGQNSIDNLCYFKDGDKLISTYGNRNKIFVHVNNYSNTEIKQKVCLSRTLKRCDNGGVTRGIDTDCEEGHTLYSIKDLDEETSKCPMNMSAINLTSTGSTKVKYVDDIDRDIEIFQHPAPIVKNSNTVLTNTINVGDNLTLSISDLKTFGPDYRSVFKGYQYYDGRNWKDVTCTSQVANNHLCVVDKDSLVYSSEKIKFRVVGTDKDTEKSQEGLPTGDYTISLKVTFDPNGGTVSPTEKTVAYNTSYGQLPTPTRADYLFDGWHTSPTDSTTVYETTKVSVKSNHTLYAHWILNVFNAKFFANKFATINQTVNGVIISYDSSSSELTLNGTSSSRIDLMRLLETFTKDTKYVTTLQYISGSYSVSSGNAYIYTSIKKNDNSALSEDNYKRVQLPTSGERSGSFTVSDVGKNEGGQLYVRIDKAASANISFNNYKIKVTISEDKTWRVTNGNKYKYGNENSFPTPKRIGHSFAGWYTSESGGTRVYADSNVKLSDDITLYAHWTPYKTVIKYNINGGRITKNLDLYSSSTDGYVYYNGSILTNSYNYGKSLSDSGLANYNNSGYLYVLKDNYSVESRKEWICKNQSCNGKTYDQRDTVNTNYKPSDFCDASYGNCEALLYINWIPYLNLDWELDGTKYTDDFPYATADVYVGGSIVAEGVSDYSNAWANGKNYEIKNISPKTGYTCDGVVSGSKPLSGKIDDTTSVTIKCNAKKVKVTFMRNTSSTDNVKSEQTFTYGVSGQSFSDKGWTKTGYTLAGWALTRDATSANYRKTSGVIDSWINTYSPSVTIYAVWDTNSYYLDLNAVVNGTARSSLSGVATADVKISGTLVSNDTSDYYQKHDYNTSYQITDIKPATGYTCSGIASGSSPLSGTITGATTVKINCTTSEYNISYNYITGNCNGTTPTSGVPSKYKYGEGATINGVPTKSGYTFNGWSDNSSLTGAAFTKTVSKTSTGAKTFYAKCCQNCATVSNGTCSLNASTAGTCKYTTSCNTGYTLTSGANTRSPVCSPITYTVTYNMNGGSGGPSNQTKNYNTALKLSSTTPTRSGYTFMGWGTSASEKTASYQPGDNYTTNANKTLYALWKKTITVTFDRYKLLWMSSSTRTCYIWNAETSCTVTSPGVTAISGSSSRGSSNDSKYSGYGNQTFNSLFDYDGWDTRKDVYPATYEFGQTISVSANTTYYANISLKTKYYIAFPNNQYGLYCRKSAGAEYKISNFTGMIDTNYASVYASFTATNYFAWQYTTSGDYRLWIRGTGTPLMNDSSGNFPNGTCADRWVPANWLSW